MNRVANFRPLKKHFRLDMPIAVISCVINGKLVRRHDYQELILVRDDDWSLFFGYIAEYLVMGAEQVNISQRPIYGKPATRAEFAMSEMVAYELEYEERLEPICENCGHTIQHGEPPEGMDEDKFERMKNKLSFWANAGYKPTEPHPHTPPYWVPENCPVCGGPPGMRVDWVFKERFNKPIC
jgi:rRNA maturation protein Nop10